MGNFDDLKSIDLKNSGLKTTLPRLKILNLFEQSSVRHLSAEDVYKELINEGEDIGLAPVQFNHARQISCFPQNLLDGFV